MVAAFSLDKSIVIELSSAAPQPVWNIASAITAAVTTAAAFLNILVYLRFL